MPMRPQRKRGGSLLAGAGLLAALSFLVLPDASAQTAAGRTAGEVEFTRGVGYAQSPGRGPRILGKGLAFQEGDTLSTAAGSSAIFRMTDGTRMTLRPGTDMVVQRFQYTRVPRTTAWSCNCSPVACAPSPA